MKSKKLWYAVSKRGHGMVYTTKPDRHEFLGVLRCNIEGCYCSVVADMEASGFLRLPQLTWNDEPVELNLTITHG